MDCRELHCGPNDKARLQSLRETAKRYDLPLVASGDVHMHVRSRRRLQDVLTAIRLGRPVAQCGHALFPNAERHLRLRMRLAQLYPPGLLAETVCDRRALPFFARRAALRVSGEIVPAGRDAGVIAAQADRGGLRRRFPDGVPPNVARADRARARARSPSSATSRFSSPCTTSSLSRAAKASCARDAARPRTRPSAMPRHHRSRPGAHEHAVRALHLARAQRAAGHRRRLRAPAARGGDPVRLRQVRPRPRALAATVITYRRKARCATSARRSACRSTQVDRAGEVCVVGRRAIDERAIAKAASIPSTR